MSVPFMKELDSRKTGLESQKSHVLIPWPHLHVGGYSAFKPICYSWVDGKASQ